MSEYQVETKVGQTLVTMAETMELLFEAVKLMASPEAGTPPDVTPLISTLLALAVVITPEMSVELDEAMSAAFHRSGGDLA